MGAEPTQYKWPTKRLKNNQVFEICDMPSYFITYKDLVARPRAEVLEEVKEHFSEPFTFHPKEYVDGEMVTKDPVTREGREPTQEELEELSGYFDRFIKDVDEDFKLRHFIRYEWYYPFRNKIIWKLRKLKERYEQD